MSDAIIVALLTGGLALIGTIISSWATSKKTAESFRVSQAVLETKLDELTRDVREHNDFARRMPVLEARVDAMEKRVESIEGGGGNK